MTPNCKSCFHYKPEEDKTFVLDYGYCKRFPPAVMSDGDGHPCSEWPVVDEVSHCGEWKAGQ